LFKYANIIILISGTLLSDNLISRELGITHIPSLWIEMNSPFPVKNRLIHIRSIGRVNNRSLRNLMPSMISACNSIMNDYPLHKGVIYTSSYKLADLLYDGIKSDRLLIHHSKDREDVTNKFIETDDNSVLITGFNREGISLDDDLCRFAIIPKMTFPDMTDERIKILMEIDKEKVNVDVVRDILQIYGRGVRNKKDWCQTYVLDANFWYLYSKYKNFFPKWFRSAIRGFKKGKKKRKK
jgi:Rad3-related DNA helicase